MTTTTETAEAREVAALLASVAALSAQVTKLTPATPGRRKMLRGLAKEIQAMADRDDAMDDPRLGEVSAALRTLAADIRAVSRG